MLELYKSPWRTRFEDAVRSAKTEIVLVAPFIKTAEAERICRAVNGLVLDGPLRVNVMTNLRADSILARALDLGALKIFQALLEDLNLVTLPRLHAKVYIVDRSLAIVGSANLTSSALDTNYEYSVGVKDPAVVGQIYDDMLSYAALGSALNRGQVDELYDITRELTAAYNEAQKSVSAPIRKSFDEALRRVNRKFAQAFVGEKSSNAVFSGAILHVLASGPKPTGEIHTHVQQLLPELCDDSVELVINSERYGKAWKHGVRNAQQSLKSRGLVSRIDRYWRLVPNTDGRG